MPCFALEGQGNFVRRTAVFESGTFLYPTLARGQFDFGVNAGLPLLSEKRANHFAVNICQAALTAVVIERQFLVIQAEQVQDRRMKIVDRADIFFRFVAEFIRCAITQARFDACSRHPRCKAVGIVIAPLTARLIGRHSPEFCCPQNQGIVQHSALCQIGEECGTRTGFRFSDWQCR